MQRLQWTAELGCFRPSRHQTFTDTGSRPLMRAGDTTQNASGDLVSAPELLLGGLAKARAKEDMRIRQAGEGLRICQAARGSSCLGPLLREVSMKEAGRHHIRGMQSALRSAHPA